MDGNRHQVERINAEATARGIEVSIVVDLVHVLEYIWKAAWSFHAEADPVTEEWVQEKALEVLRGKATIGRGRDPAQGHGARPRGPSP